MPTVEEINDRNKLMNLNTHFFFYHKQEMGTERKLTKKP